jgi:hypothetical protein
VAGDLICELGEVLSGMDRGEAPDGFGRKKVGQFLEDFGAQQLGRAVVHLGEAGGHAGLEREAAQERGAEAVNRLDAKAARRLDRAGEKLAGAGEAERGKLGLAQVEERRAKIVVGLHRPFAQPPEEAVLHLGGGGLGVGEAEDALRFDPLEEKPRHPVGQDARLAGPGVRREPGVGRRVGGTDLRKGCRGDRHSCPPAMVMSHSPKRERWS